MFGDLFNRNPNAMAEALASEADDIIDQIFNKFDQNNMSASYATILKMMASKYELIKSFLTLDVIKTLCKYSVNPVFDISSEALTVLIEILFPESSKDSQDRTSKMREEVGDIPFFKHSQLV